MQMKCILIFFLLLFNFIDCLILLSRVAMCLSNFKNRQQVDDFGASYERMTGWQIHNYGKLDELKFSETLKKPTIKTPYELLVKIEASSVNHLDLLMIEGYGKTLLNLVRCYRGDIEFPLVLGRDFVGTVLEKGNGISDEEFEVGDKIWGVVQGFDQGCHCQYITIDRFFVSKKPRNLSDLEAAVVLYAGLTAYSGIFYAAQFGGIHKIFSDRTTGSGIGKKVLVIGGSGGVGHLAIQMLQAEGAKVLTSVSTDAVPLMQKLNVSKVIDYKSPESNKMLVSEGPYDLILDCAHRGPEYAKSLPWKFKTYATFYPPLLNNIDEKGVLRGSLASVQALVSQNSMALNGNGNIAWGFIVPNKKAILYLKNLAEEGKLVPIIDSIFSYNDMLKAYEKTAKGHLRGKVAIEF